MDSISLGESLNDFRTRGTKHQFYPFFMLIVFLFFLSLFSGPAFNLNGFRAFLRASQFLEGSENPESLLLQSGKIFQSMSLILVGLVGVVVDLIGPRITHSIGYILFGSSALLMMHWSTLWYGMLLQGSAAVFLFYSAIHLANLFEHHSNFVISILSTSSELGFLLYPALTALSTFGIPARVLVFILVGLCGLGMSLTLLLMPDEPFIPRSEQARANLQRASMFRSAEQKPEIWKLADSRDVWGDPSETKETEETEETKAETSQLLPAGREGRLSSISVSVVALVERDSGEAVLADNENAGTLRQQLVSIEWILFTLIFSFSVFRSNLYLDGNEQILTAMGDADERLTTTLAYLMPLGFIPTLVNGALIDRLGVIPMMLILNVCGMAVNLLSRVKWLNLQNLTFILFIFSRSSCWNLLFLYNLGRFGLRNLGLLIGASFMICGVINLGLGTLVLNAVVKSGTQKWDGINLALAVYGLLACTALVLLWFLQLRNKRRS